MSELDVFRRQDFGHRLGCGRSAALLIVDFTVAFNDPAMFGGGNIAAAVERSVALLDFFRTTQRPVVHTRVVYADDGSDGGMLARKVPRLLVLTAANPASRIVPTLAPRPDELVLNKRHASAFFGTELASWLRARAVDTVVVAGCTTSGCVRASVVAANGHDFRPIVVRDCVGDRAAGPHQASLFDMAQKYADVVDRDQLVDELSRSVPQD